MVFTSQYSTPSFPNWARLKNLRTLIATARRCPELFFLIKPHPLRESLPSSITDVLPDNVVINTDFSTVKALKAAHVAVTYWSTTALEATLLGTPLVQLNATGLPDFLDLSSKLGRSIARDAASLLTLLHATLRTPSKQLEHQRKRFLLEHQIRLDARATQRATQAIAANLQGEDLVPKD